MILYKDDHKDVRIVKWHQHIDFDAFILSFDLGHNFVLDKNV